jgi:hypothetical protein
MKLNSHLIFGRRITVSHIVLRWSSNQLLSYSYDEIEINMIERFQKRIDKKPCLFFSSKGIENVAITFSSNNEL